MNDIRRPWKFRALIGLVALVMMFGVADVAGLTPHAPIGASAGSPRAARVIEPAQVEMADEVRRSVLPSSTSKPVPEPALAPRPSTEERHTAEPRSRHRHHRRHHRTAQPVVALEQATPAPAPPTPAPPAHAPPGQPLIAPRVTLPTLPASILNLNDWKLTLPVGKKGRPAEIRQPDLGSFHDGRFFGLDPSRSGVIFRANAGGVTTENSGYPRSELREMAASSEAAWTSRRGTHLMTITQAITATPRRKPHVVAAQIHDADDDVMAIRLEGSQLFVDANGRLAGVLDPHYVLGAKYAIEISASAAGIRVTYNGRPQAGGAPARVVTLPQTGKGWYFKVGCYTQSNPSTGDDPAAYGEVIVYSLTVLHTA